MKNLTKCKYLSFYSEICNTNIADAKSDKIRIFININLLYETGNSDIKIRRYLHMNIVDEKSVHLLFEVGDSDAKSDKI